MSSIEITPLAFESLGVRSMCTFVETPDVRVLIDAGVALGYRFRLLPHPLEYRVRRECREKIREAASKADVITVSHYHNDHHTPNFAETELIGCSRREAERIYRDKIVLFKDIRSAINFSQRRRGWMFQQFCKKISKEQHVADGRRFEFGKTAVRFSEPVVHGEEQTELGWVLMCTVEYENRKFVHAPDIQGPMSEATLQLLVSERPDVLVLGGPPLYLVDSKVARSSFERGMTHAAELAKVVPTIILDHHLLRDAQWRESAQPILDAARSHAHKVVTAAEYMGVQDSLLEASRRELYEKHPPSKSYLAWTKLGSEKRRKTNPPTR